MTTANWISVISAFLGIVITVILFLVGRLLNANKEMVDTLAQSIRDQSRNNQEAFRDLFACIDTLRTKLGAVDVRVARLEAWRNERQELKERAAGG